MAAQPNALQSTVSLSELPMPAMCSEPHTRKLLQPGTALTLLENLKPPAATGTRLRSRPKLTGAQREAAESHKGFSTFILAVYEGHIHTLLWRGRQEKALLLSHTRPAPSTQYPIVQHLATTPRINQLPMMPTAGHTGGPTQALTSLPHQ